MVHVNFKTKNAFKLGLKYIQFLLKTVQLILT